MLGVVEDVGVHAVSVAVQQLHFRVLGPQVIHLVGQQLVVVRGDFVEVAEAAMAVVFGVGVAVEREHGGHASEGREVDDEDGFGSGHDDGGHSRRRVCHRCHHILQLRAKTHSQPCYIAE